MRQENWVKVMFGNPNEERAEKRDDQMCQVLLTGQA